MVRLCTRIHDETLQKFSAHVALRVWHPSTRVIDPEAPAVPSYGTGSPIPVQRPTGGFHPSTGDPASCDP